MSVGYLEESKLQDFPGVNTPNRLSLSLSLLGLTHSASWNRRARLFSKQGLYYNTYKNAILCGSNPSYSEYNTLIKQCNGTHIQITFLGMYSVTGCILKVSFPTLVVAAVA